ncbi:MAG TPA: hypothetical protein VGI56_15055 [Galbitalea sp.]|jgi:hypothetical protein
MTADADEFTGTFAGETPLSKPVPPSAAEAARLKALAKYEVDPNKPVKPRKVAKPPVDIVRLTVIIGSAMVVCIVAGVLLFKLTPTGSPQSTVGEYLLVANVLFVFALLRVWSQRRH